MERIDFKSLKQTISLEMVLSHYGIALKKVSATSLRGKCPLPMHGSKTSDQSFSVNLAKGAGGVWACKSQSCVAARGGNTDGDTIRFVAWMQNCSLPEAAATMLAWFPTSGKPQGQRHPPKQTPEETPVSKEIAGTLPTVNVPITFRLQGVDPAHPYLAGRGITEEIARKFGVGHFNGRGLMHNRIVFEIHNEQGELLAYAGRAIEDADEPRYKFPPGFHKSLELYNLHRVIMESNRRRRVVLVEGFFPCLSVNAIGFPCVALMGHSMSKEQEELIVHYFDVACILLDSNDVGKQGSADCLLRLGRRMYAYAPLLPEGAQPDTMTPEALYAFIKR